jgi:beta-glucosidase
MTRKNNAKGFSAAAIFTKPARLLMALGFATLATACEQADEIDTRAQNILHRMSLEEKVGQVIQGDISTVSPQDVKDYHLGSILNGGNSAPGGGKTASWQEWVDLGHRRGAWAQ